jgi:hypothetical protein
MAQWPFRAAGINASSPLHPRSQLCPAGEGPDWDSSVARRVPHSIAARPCLVKQGSSGYLVVHGTRGGTK